MREILKIEIAKRLGIGLPGFSPLKPLGYLSDLLVMNVGISDI